MTYGCGADTCESCYPASEREYVTWDAINEALDAYDDAKDADRDQAIEDLLDTYDKATPEQQEYIAESAGTWVRG